MNTTFTSPFTGLTYTAIPNTLWSSAIGEDGNSVKVWYTVYNFFYQGKLVTSTYSLEENCLIATFARLEN